MLPKLEKLEAPPVCPNFANPEESPVAAEKGLAFVSEDCDAAQGDGLLPIPPTAPNPEPLAGPIAEGAPKAGCPDWPTEEGAPNTVGCVGLPKADCPDWPTEEGAPNAAGCVGLPKADCPAWPTEEGAPNAGCADWPIDEGAPNEGAPNAGCGGLPNFGAGKGVEAEPNPGVPKPGGVGLINPVLPDGALAGVPKVAVGFPNMLLDPPADDV